MLSYCTLRFKCSFCTQHLKWEFLITEFSIPGAEQEGNKVKLPTSVN